MSDFKKCDNREEKTIFRDSRGTYAGTETIVRTQIADSRIPRARGLEENQSDVITDQRATIAAAAEGDKETVTIPMNGDASLPPRIDA